MLTIIETPIFQRMVEGIWSEPEREAFIVFISDNPLAGAVIPGAGSLRKVRWKRRTLKGRAMRTPPTVYWVFALASMVCAGMPAAMIFP